MIDQQDIPDDAALAAEFVLRLLDVDAELAFEKRLQDEPDVRAQVWFWEEKFSALANTLPDVAPPSNLKAKLIAQVEGTNKGSRFSWAWGWLAFPGLAVIAIAGFLSFGPMLSSPTFDPSLHATLISEDGALHIEAGYAPDGNLFKVIPEEGSPSSGRDFELWVINPNAEAPVSLGVIPADRESLFEITPEIAALIDGGTLAVSDEPRGGSLTGAPTGAILATDVFFDADLYQPD